MKPCNGLPDGACFTTADLPRPEFAEEEHVIICQAHLAAPLWLPVAPAAEIGVLSIERRRVYIARFLQRVLRPGWLIEPLCAGADAQSPDYAWVTREIARSHRPARRIQNADYALTWYVPR